MRTIQVSVYLGPLSLSILSVMLLPCSHALHAQAPAVAVRILESIDSSKEPSGKQHRASVSKAVDAGNGVSIPQGAAALVTLVHSGNGWTTQLVSVTVNGQPAAVTSGPASLTSAGQSAAASAMSSVSSVLGGFGHHVSAPAGEPPASASSCRPELR